MKVIFHERFHDVYTHDPASAEGRIRAITGALEGIYEFIEPSPASEADLKLVHSPAHIGSVAHQPHLFKIARLAAGGAIKAASFAFNGEPAFGLVRPPGHHASPSSCWGFCYFNNIAIAVKRLLADGNIKSAFILDFDLHYGDGTANTFAGNPSIEYYHPKGELRLDFIDNIRKKLDKAGEYDLLAVSAGFDRHEDDWGGLLTTDDYETIGVLLKDFSINKCKGRRFGVLEGGYNHLVLGLNVRSFLIGFS